ncbi:MAG TPA: GH116 family glycosyl hydrolase [Planctomycetota bacterium]|nr:GH116 family glycosyl hydrolase [Planctomycetota bacterium]
MRLRDRTLLFLSVVGFALSALAAEPGEEFKHFVPVDKKLAPEWVAALTQRGQPEVWSGKDLVTIGMPIGGVAAGQLYLRGDGTFAQWWIFNKHINTGYGNTCYRTYRPASPVESGFAVAIEADGKSVVKKLNEQDFPGVEFVGEYPIAVVRYADKDFPVKVEMEAFSPFIPLNARDSALPATLFHITVENASAKPLKASVVGWLENAVLCNSAAAVHALRRSRIVSEGGRTMAVHSAEKAPMPPGAEKPRETIVLADFEGETYADWKATGEAFGKGPAKGTLPEQQSVEGFLGKGLVNTYLGKDGPHGTLTSPPLKVERKFINFLIGGGNQAGETCIVLLVGGKAVRTAVGKDNERLDWHFWNVEEFEGKEAQIEIVDKASGGWGHINVDQIEQADKPRQGPSGAVEEMADFGSMVLALAEAGAPAGKLVPALNTAGLHAEADASYPAAQRRSAALATQAIELAPAAKRTFVFALAWHFPNHPRGREYAERFKSAQDVARYALDNQARLADHTRLWHKTFYDDSTLPRWLLFRLHSTVSNLATDTCQWWSNGRFWAWEGVGCCEGTCTHVWNYAHASARLFPEIERIIREMQDFGAAFDEKTGLVGFRSNRAYAADGQCGGILKAYREHLMSPDDAFLQRTWPRIKQALEFSIKQDANDDGLIENSQHNTYDINFQGPNTFVGSLYLAALRAGEEMAKDVGDADFAARCRKIFESGSKLTLERLWDGEYFIQDVDLAKFPKHQYGKGCLADQLFGQGWAHQLGLGYIYPEKSVKSALNAIWKYCWAPDVGPQNKAHPPQRWFARPGEAGLFTCTWPKSPHLGPQSVLYRDEIWTGIEYQAAGNMVWDGLLTEALAICRGIQDRYHPSKHNPYNEVECGDHYARAMASWGVYTALCGYEYHGPKGHLGFAPRLTPDDFRAAFTAAEGWGLFTQKRQGNVQANRIEVRWGKLRLKTLALAVREGLKTPTVAVTVAGKPVEASSSVKDGRLLITLAGELMLGEGQTFEALIK